MGNAPISIIDWAMLQVYSGTAGQSSKHCPESLLRLVRKSWRVERKEWREKKGYRA